MSPINKLRNFKSHPVVGKVIFQYLVTKFKSLSQLIGENNEQMNSLKSNSAHLVEQVQRSQRLNRGKKV